jgi:hypothetical protein
MSAQAPNIQKRFSQIEPPITQKSLCGDLKLVEKGGNMSNFFVAKLERFQINMSK